MTGYSSTFSLNSGKRIQPDRIKKLVEIKCQLDATDILLQILLLAQHVSSTIRPIIRSSIVLYSWLLPVVFGALVFKLSICCGAEGCVSGLRAAGCIILSSS